MQPLVTVIIPVYNVEKYIKKCVASVQNQSYDKMEIILVDDGSVDRSGNICDNLANEDHRIRVIHQANHGLAVARNVGIEKATGEWLYFIDSDDWVSTEFLSNMMKVAQDTDAEIICCNSIDVREDGSIISENKGTGKIRVFNKYEAIKALIQKTENIRFEVWNKLWKRTLVYDTRFIEGQISEDVHFDRILFMKTNKIAYLDEYLHFYRVQRPGNTNSTFKVKRLCVFPEYSEWVAELNSLNLQDCANVISYIACNTAAGLFYEANRTGQDRETIAQLLNQFTVFYINIKGTVYDSPKLKMFNINPFLYCLISKLYKTLLNNK